MPKPYVNRRDAISIAMTLDLNREVDVGEWRETVHDLELVERVKTALYRGCIDPAREDTGFTGIKRIELTDAGSNEFSRVPDLHIPPVVDRSELAAVLRGQGIAASSFSRPNVVLDRRQYASLCRMAADALEAPAAAQPA